MFRGYLLTEYTSRFLAIRNILVLLAGLVVIFLSSGLALNITLIKGITDMSDILQAAFFTLDLLHMETKAFISPLGRRLSHNIAHLIAI